MYLQSKALIVVQFPNSARNFVNFHAILSIKRLSLLLRYPKNRS